jgi:hypothetical protein
MNVSRIAPIALALALVCTATALAQECVPGAPLTADQQARRKQGVQLTRTINNLEANQPGNRTKTYLRQVELPSSEFAKRATGGSAEMIGKMNFTPGQELRPGWQLTLDVTADGYWFMIKDKTDPCGFAYISNQNGLIFEAQPIR